MWEAVSSLGAFTCTRNVFGSAVEKQQSVAPYQLKVMPGAGRVSAGLHAALVTQEQLLLSSKHRHLTPHEYEFFLISVVL